MQIEDILLHSCPLSSWRIFYEASEFYKALKNIGVIIWVYLMCCVFATRFSSSKNFLVGWSWVITGKYCSAALHRTQFPVSCPWVGRFSKPCRFMPSPSAVNYLSVKRVNEKSGQTLTRKYWKSRLWKKLILNNLICIAQVESRVCLYKKMHLHYRLGHLDLVYTYKWFMHKFNC